ncbi:hypothetical protein J2Z50_003313 [Ensifer mexicanus]|nr:hypothetical protein [Sinorhizobium mexicanum]
MTPWTLGFPPTGRFVKVRVKDRDYWYFDQPDGEGGQKRKYVGPVEDPEITKRVEDFSTIKTDYRTRRRLVSSLTRDGGLVAADRSSGVIVEALAAAGLFRLRAVLVGTLAFGAYSGLLGVRPEAVAASAAKFLCCSRPTDTARGSTTIKPPLRSVPSA